VGFNKKIVSFFDKNFYSEFLDNWDNTLFRKKILKYLNKDAVLLDVGAGAGIVKDMNFKELVKEAHGVDLDPRVKQNPWLDKAYEGSIDSMPFLEDNKFDVVICNNVMEHVAEPEKFFAEINRVLKKDGVFLVKTPNKYHYIPFVALITPEWFHKFYNKLRGREEEDTFPTLYRGNSKKSQQILAKKSGFEVIVIDAVEGRPEYLRLNFLFYTMGILYEKIVNLLNLDLFKVIIISCFKKK